jgi:hypothetical protein
MKKFNLMKKRMQILMSLTLTAFLFLGLTSLSAQSFTTGPTIYAGPNGKTLVNYQQNAEAVNTIESELQANYPANPPQPTNAVTAGVYYRMFYLRAVKEFIAAGEETGSAIFRGYNETVNASKATFPNLVNASWQSDMVTLLSN